MGKIALIVSIAIMFEGLWLFAGVRTMKLGTELNGTFKVADVTTGVKQINANTIRKKNMDVM